MASATGSPDIVSVYHNCPVLLIPHNLSSQKARNSVGIASPDSASEVVAELVLLTTVIISGAYLNTGNIPHETSIGLAVTAGITLLWTAGVFFHTYSNHTDIYKTELYQT